MISPHGCYLHLNEDKGEQGSQVLLMSDRDDRFVSPSTTRLRVMRDGHNIIRSARIPKPVVLVDTREKEPLPLGKSWIWQLKLL